MSESPAVGQTVKDAATEAAAQAIHRSRIDTRRITFYREHAAVALAAAVPLILDEAARRIEDPAEMVPAFDEWTRGYAGGLADAARLVRALAEEWTR